MQELEFTPETLLIYQLECIKDNLNQANEIPWIVRLLENPQSPLALPGATTLDTHDCLHILLGRGFSGLDEAFVVGFSMGNDRRVRPWMLWLWLWVAQCLYPETYRLKTSQERQEFLRGVQLGQSLQHRDLNHQPVDFFLSLGQTVHEIRAALGLTFCSITPA